MGSLMKEKRIRLVIFDLDGTLIDAYRAVSESVNFTLRACGFPPVPDLTIKRTVGWGDRHLIASFVGEDNADRTLKIYRRHHKDALKRGSRLLPGALRLLKALKKRGYKLAVASNRPTRYSHIVIRHLGIRAYFDYVLCGDRIARPKPHPDILRRILRRFGVRPGQAVYVGDMGIDMQAGRRAGVRTVAVTTGSSTREELVRHKPWAVVRRADAVAAVLERLQNKNFG
ncbi:MAG: HAD family hydrolase [Candidatus Omnitrophota bacterium]|nr:HAD family hydrolase [Candidatus Omnitrophota bacterium]MDZ4241643.1 HAD family hydrolase [Candidatus Omnitrophota bacterium]